MLEEKEVKDAIKLFEDFNKMEMDDQLIIASQINVLLQRQRIEEKREREKTNRINPHSKV